MSRIELPTSTPIHFNGDLKVRADSGTLELYTDVLTWPHASVSFAGMSQGMSESDIKSLKHKIGDDNNTRFPVAMGEKELYTEPLWNELANLSDNMKGLDMTEHNYQAYRELYQQKDLQKRKPEILYSYCPSLTGHHTWVGLMAKLYGSQWIEERTNSDDKGWDTLIREIEDPLSFHDNGLTLLDLATRYQHWKSADVLWSQGVRWSNSESIENNPILHLLNGSRRILKGTHSKSAFIDTLNPKSSSKDGNHQDASAWLDAWLKRWQETGGKLETVKSKKLVTQWAEQLSITAGPRTLSWDKTPKSHQAITQIWVKFWQDNNIDFTEGLCGGWGEKPPKPFRELWANSEGLNEAITSFILESSLKPPTKIPSTRHRL